MLLDLPSGELDIIERDNMYRVEDRYLAMLQKWLDVDPDASWAKWFKVVDKIFINGENIEAGIATHIFSYQSSHVTFIGLDIYI